MSDKSKVLGILLGDACGIGPELIIKALTHQEIRNSVCWFILGDLRVFNQGEQFAGNKIQIKLIEDFSEVVAEKGKVYFKDTKNLSVDDYTIGQISEKSGEATGNTLKEMIAICKKNAIDGVLYGPFNKQALQKGGHHFSDEAHFYASLFDHEDKEFGEINILDDLWVTRVTSHVPMKAVGKMIKKDLILRKIIFADTYLRNAGVKNPSIFVASYNPHSGEGGLLGTEEIDEIVPAITEAQNKGINVVGPYPADTIFLKRESEKFDCLLAMYHDQAQIGIKLLGFSRGVTLSAGFPIPLATPAHGTAFDIASKGIANENATLAAIKVLFRLTGIRI